MRCTLIAATCMLVLALAGQANAKIIAGQYVPDSLTTGDQYRLLIVTSGSTAASSGAVATYDTFVKFEADRAGSLVSGFAWEAIVSTSDAIASARADNAGVKVYGLNNALGSDPTDLLAADYASLFTGAGPGTREYDQFGNSMGNSIMWTGSHDDGTATTKLLGSALPTWGFAGTTYTKWLEFNPTFIPLDFPASSEFRIYGISEVLTVPVPEPATIVMWSLFAGVAGLVFWRKGRKSS